MHGACETQEKVFEYNTSGNDPVSQLRKKAIPAKKRGEPDITQPPWWNEDVDKLWHEKRAAFEIYQIYCEDPELKRELHHLGQHCSLSQHISGSGWGLLLAHEIPR